MAEAGPAAESPGKACAMYVNPLSAQGLQFRPAMRVGGWKEVETMEDLATKKCEPCEGGMPALKGLELRRLYGQLEGWTMVNEHHLEKEYLFQDFRQALDFVNRLGEVAEQEGHHPDIFLTWGKVKVTLWTHAVGGLSENDFILAAKADALR
jgi:4a-hydroxytetrahydrobiopterin dehydratase